MVDVPDIGESDRRDLRNWREPHRFIHAQRISPAFVRMAVERYGADSIKSLFMLDECDEAYWIEYLLRRHKGRYFRKRYPPIAVV